MSSTFVELNRRMLSALIRVPDIYAEVTDNIFRRAWISYLLVIAIQFKMIWGIWYYRDLTSGDTSAYAFGATHWRDNFHVDIVWSPVYTAFYGTIIMMTDGMYSATITHRIVIVLAAAIGVLAVTRQLLSPALALLVTIWWAIMPINFDTLYEVHLFGLLPVLLAWWVVGISDSSKARGAALGILLFTTVLVRNEYIIGFSAFALSCISIELWQLRNARNRQSMAVRPLIIAYLVPTFISLSIFLFFYARTPLSVGQIASEIEMKHTLNMCQVYAFGYQQRTPSWTLSPWTDCYSLMKATFGQDLPSLMTMIKTNILAVCSHVLWNVSLVPSGIQVGLFNSMSGGVNPDYAPVLYRRIVIVPSLIAIGIVVLGGVRIVQHRTNWWHRWFKPRMWQWIVLISTLLVSIPIIVTQRPRPSYLFPSTIVLMVVIATAVFILTIKQERFVRLASIITAILTFVLLPPYYTHSTSDRPLYSAYEAVYPYKFAFEKSPAKIYIGDYSGELVNYLELQNHNIKLVEGDLMQVWGEKGTLDQFFRAKGVTVAFLNSRVLRSISGSTLAAPLLSDPTKFGWRRVAPSAGEQAGWLLLTRDDQPATR